MSIVTELTPVYYRTIRISLHRDNGTLEIQSDISIHNADKRMVGDDHPTPTITAELRAALGTWYAERSATYEAATGLLPLPIEPPVEAD